MKDWETYLIRAGKRTGMLTMEEKAVLISSGPELPGILEKLPQAPLNALGAGDTSLNQR